MLQLGIFQNLTVVSRKEHGVYLAESKESADARVLLPAKEVPEDTQIGEPLRVFLYRDSMDRLIATREQPLIALHEVKLLKVREVTGIGAFLDWGLPKDLLLPYAEILEPGAGLAGRGEAADLPPDIRGGKAGRNGRRAERVGKQMSGGRGRRSETALCAGDEVLAALYEDKSGRLAATMKIYPYLETQSPYIKGMHVTARIYQIEESFGAFAAVDDRYSGLIPRREMNGDERVGDVLTLRVTAVHEDGKLDLSPREEAAFMMEEDAEKIYEIISGTYGGTLPFDDKASPDQIREVFGLSKAAFKRAVGRLYKERRILLDGGKIEII